MIKLLRQLRDAALGPVGTAFRFGRAPQESGILGRELAKLTLHNIYGDALFGGLLGDGGDPIRSPPLLTDADQLVEDIAVIGVDGITSNARLPRESCDGQLPFDHRRPHGAAGQAVEGSAQLLGCRLHAPIKWVCGRHLRHGLLL